VVRLSPLPKTDPQGTSYVHQDFLSPKLDVTNPTDIDASFQTPVGKLSRIDVVVRCGPAEPFRELTNAGVDGRQPLRL
jgi:hypothetical protein